MAQMPLDDDQQSDQAVSDSVNFQRFVGINNLSSRERLKPIELEIAKNIDVDDTGQIHRRRGYKKVLEGRCHSVYHPSSQSFVYVVRNGDLCVVYPNYTFSTLLTGAGQERISYVEIADKTYFSSPVVSGVINADLTVSPWGAQVSEGTWLSPIVNPTETLSPVFGKLLGKPPLATALTYFNGRIYLAQGKTVWATELYLYNYVDKTKNWIQFESDVTMLASVSDGIYVGTDTDIWFLSGPFSEMRRVKVHPYRAVPGSAVYVPTSYIDTERISTKMAVMFMTDLGLCTGLDEGYIISNTSDRVWFPKAESAAALFRVQDGFTQYVGVTDSSGSPSSRARIGDYVDAEIRRFQGA